MSTRPRAFHHADEGTSEQVWRAWSSTIESVHFSDLPVDGRVVVVAPHPDDESLGAGGTVASLSALGAQVHVVVCTDGDAAAPPDWLSDPTSLGAVRRREVTAAAEHLSPGRPVTLHLLGLRDGGLSAARPELDARLEPLLDGASLVIAPWPDDGHPDHRAVGLAVRAVSTAPRLEYPIWAWHWAVPSELPDGVVRVPISPSAQQHRAAAVACHRSQLTGADPVVGPDVLRHFERDHEVFVADAATRASLRPVDRSSRRFFDDLHRSSPSGDPWEFGTSAPEVARHEHLDSLLEGSPSRHALEIGCSTGHLTRRLARRTSRLLAVDTSTGAIDGAARTCRGIDHVELRVAHVPDDLTPDDRDFDLVVLSEVGYYFTVDRLEALVDDLARRSVPGALLLAAHWTGHSEDHVLDGATTHRVIADRPGWMPVRSAPMGAHLVELWRRR